MEVTMRRRLFATAVALLAAASLAPAQDYGPASPLGATDGRTGGCPGCASPFWASAEYLLWWVKAGPLPLPLIATGSTADPLPGALGQPGTSLVFGNTHNDYHTFSGVRIGAGY